MNHAAADPGAGHAAPGRDIRGILDRNLIKVPTEAASNPGAIIAADPGAISSAVRFNSSPVDPDLDAGAVSAFLRAAADPGSSLASLCTHRTVIDRDDARRIGLAQTPVICASDSGASGIAGVCGDYPAIDRDGACELFLPVAIIYISAADRSRTFLREREAPVASFPS